MECRAGCAACCIAISITSPLPGMPNGKPAGVLCCNLDENYFCTIHKSPDYPEVCRNFLPDVFYCGHTNKEAFEIIERIEEATK